jgi:hypothetical protein
MSDTRLAMREFRFLDEKRKQGGLSSVEEQRWTELRQWLGIDAGGDTGPQSSAPPPYEEQQPLGYYASDGNWYPLPPGYAPPAPPGYPPQPPYGYPEYPESFSPPPPYPQPGAENSGQAYSGYAQDPYGNAYPGAEPYPPPGYAVPSGYAAPYDPYAYGTTPDEPLAAQPEPAFAGEFQELPPVQPLPSFTESSLPPAEEQGQQPAAELLGLTDRPQPPPPPPAESLPLQATSESSADLEDDVAEIDPDDVTLVEAEVEVEVRVPSTNKFRIPQVPAPVAAPAASPTPPPTKAEPLPPLEASPSPAAPIEPLAEAALPALEPLPPAEPGSEPLFPDLPPLPAPDARTEPAFPDLKSLRQAETVAESALPTVPHPQPLAAPDLPTEPAFPDLKLFSQPEARTKTASTDRQPPPAPQTRPETAFPDLPPLPAPAPIAETAFPDLDVLPPAPNEAALASATTEQPTIELSETDAIPAPLPVASPPAQDASVGRPESKTEPPKPRAESSPPVRHPAIPSAGSIGTAAPAIPSASPSLAPLRVEGEHKVIVHTLEGQVRRGTLQDIDLHDRVIRLQSQDSDTPEEILTERIKAIFFMSHGTSTSAERVTPQGAKKIRVILVDGRQLAGFSTDFEGNTPGFFLVPADSRTKTARVYLFRASVQSISED